MTRRRALVPGLLAASLAVTVAASLSAPAAQAADERPMITVASGQNLPPLVATTTYDAGPGFADDIRAYQSSGQFAKDRAKVVNQATGFLRNWLRDECADRSACKPAVVFDIDDTLVSWYSALSSIDFGWNSQLDATVKEQCLTPKIRSTAALFNEAKRRNIDVFLITGRNEPDRAVTVSCLAQLGLTGYKELILRSADQKSLTAEAYKSSERKGIELRGYRIALAIGDQVSDSSGGYTDGAFVLPNPMYFIP